MTKKLTTEQRAALAAYAMDRGRTWKSQLRQDWENGRASGPLQEIRNSFGPGWLTTFRLDPLKDKAPIGFAIERTFGRWKDSLADIANGMIWVSCQSRHGICYSTEDEARQALAHVLEIAALWRDEVNQHGLPISISAAHFTFEIVPLTTVR